MQRIAAPHVPGPSASGEPRYRCCSRWLPGTLLQPATRALPQPRTLQIAAWCPPVWHGLSFLTPNGTWALKIFISGLAPSPALSFGPCRQGESGISPCSTGNSQRSLPASITATNCRSGGTGRCRSQPSAGSDSTAASNFTTERSCEAEDQLGADDRFAAQRSVRPFRGCPFLSCTADYHGGGFQAGLRATSGSKGSDGSGPSRRPRAIRRAG